MKQVTVEGFCQVGTREVDSKYCTWFWWEGFLTEVGKDMLMSIIRIGKQRTSTLPCRVAWLSCCAFKLNICFQILTWLMGVRWLESQWALSCHHVQTPLVMGMFTQCGIAWFPSLYFFLFLPGLWRSRCLTLNKSRDPNQRPMLCSSLQEYGIWNVLCRSQFIWCASAWPGFWSQVWEGLGNMKPPSPHHHLEQPTGHTNLRFSWDSPTNLCGL